MYTEDCVCINKTDDGAYILSVRTKKKKSKDSKKEVMDMSFPGSGCETKTLTAQTTEELYAKLDTILPGIKAGCMEEEEFKKAFGESMDEDEE